MIDARVFRTILFSDTEISEDAFTVTKEIKLSGVPSEGDSLRIRTNVFEMDSIVYREDGTLEVHLMKQAASDRNSMKDLILLYRHCGFNFSVIHKDFVTDVLSIIEPEDNAEA